MLWHLRLGLRSEEKHDLGLNHTMWNYRQFYFVCTALFLKFYSGHVGACMCVCAHARAHTHDCMYVRIHSCPLHANKYLYWSTGIDIHDKAQFFLPETTEYIWQPAGLMNDRVIGRWTPQKTNKWSRGSMNDWRGTCTCLTTNLWSTPYSVAGIVCVFPRFQDTPVLWNLE